ncbi:invasion associated locus B family protein [Aliiroseovarius subalbicans]|uniref:invasion associated locus B family protein n=1 Tax=Aliiroseovarius subalbicans TaxID=2925840 RepID=UPI001F576E06|nr:invasion associated locus B family protein [Aliiroseovarius subalbicans]MCI2399866.1 invasion associated locus B family protein [Aliiroseovarius subalbicans]
MKSIFARGMCTIALSLAATGVFAQESSNRVAANTDWSVFEEAQNNECWAVSTPKESTITQNGRLVAANRGDILLFVSYWKGQNGTGEVSFAGGYPFANGSTVSMTIGSSRFDLFTDGETAWSAGPDDDQKIIAAMKRGAQAILVGQSSRGKKTEDKFSLLGFTAAVDDAGKRCK